MKDRFSSHARQYAAFRPTYPDELYDFIFSHLNHFTTAWDAGTGNGQVARALAGKFKSVMATDISSEQLGNAYLADNIFYSQAAEETHFPGKSFDLITVAQAIHWFDREKFYLEVKRVAKPGALLAVWGYGLVSIHQEIDPHLKHFYMQVVGPYWDKERKLVDKEYRTIPFPFQEISVPEFTFPLEWTLEEFQGYLNTWSAVQKYIKANHGNPVDTFIQRVRHLWGLDRQTVHFPLFLRLGIIHQEEQS